MRLRKASPSSIVLLLSAIIALLGTASRADALRPPAVPLVACDPYFSIWSPADTLNGADTVHWTGKPHRLTSLARIDGQTLRVMGKDPDGMEALQQTGLEVFPTRTIYEFEGHGVHLKLTFMTAALPEDISILSRPVTYVTYDLTSGDGKDHSVELFFEASAELTVNTRQQEVELGKFDGSSSLIVLKVGSKEQPVLGKKGDDLRIDWGYLYLAAARSSKAVKCQGDRAWMEQHFAGDSLSDAAKTPPATNTESTAIALAFPTLKLTTLKPASRWLMLAYDDLYSIQYMQKNLRPYWRRTGWEAADLLKASANDYESLKKRCEAFDAELMADTARTGGAKYAALCALAYRQCFAAGKFVADASGQPLQFCKENHSNGCIGTSDVFYPMSPQFLLFGPTLAKSFLVPFMNYAASPRWKFPFAPHDLGTYPKANGQVYGGGERTEANQMPVEESGNLLILLTAIAEMEGNASFAGLYWPQLEKWAEYLKAKGFDPENQLCTDDFAGHLAHNVNLSAKAICGLGAFARLCEMRGDKAKAAEYSQLAKEFAGRWTKEALEDDHYRLAFDKPGTWSQKYNLIWDRILGLNLWPAEVARKEMDYYKKTQNRFGLPLDNRKTYTKLDWILWTATLTQDRTDFESLVDPVYLFLQETGNRSPMTDWYQTVDAKKVGFTARPVVGGVFAQMLYDKPTWKKYAGRDKTRGANWAAMPTPPKVKTVVAAADREPAEWAYTTDKPNADWSKPGYNASDWKHGKSGFGTSMTPGSIVGTPWNTDDIWLRRDVELPEIKNRHLSAWLHHDEDVEVYVNGVLALKSAGFVSSYEAVPLNSAGSAALKPGKNLIAIHCHQTTGGQYIDLGFVEEESN